MQKSTIDHFKNDYKKFSNFYPIVIHYEGRNYPSVEHAYVAAKSKDEMFRSRISFIPKNKANDAKTEGRKIRLRENWDLMKYSVMKRLLYQKFSYAEFRELLLSTEDAIIIEGNYWHDNYWGNCYCLKCKKIKGRNKLGALLMEIRGNI